MTYFSKQYFTDGLTFSSLQQDIKNYSWQNFFCDARAGLTVAFVTVPMAMAFALVAGLPISTGLYTAIYSALLASLFGSCRQMIIGPSNTIAILVQVGIATILYNDYRDAPPEMREQIALGILVQLSFLVGIFHMAAAFFKIGRLTQFVSYSVVVGYLAGTAMALMVSQLFYFVGMAPPEKAMTMYKSLVYIVKHASETHLPTLFVGSCCVVILCILGRGNNKIPSAAIVLMLAIGAVQFLSGQNQVAGFADIQRVGDTGVFSDIFPTLHFPFLDLELINELLPMAFAIALLSSLETTLVAKSITTSTGQPLSIDQELFGLGLANLFSSIVVALPSSGSVSRSQLLFKEGGKTHFSGVFSALWVAILVAIFGYFVKRIPLTALSAILLYTSIRIINWRHLFLCARATRADRLVLITTFCSCFFFGLDVAFYVGVTISIGLYLQKASVPYFVECVFDESGSIDSTHSTTRVGSGQIRVINVQGELFFGAADLFQNTLKSVTRHDVDLKVVILRLKNARDIDATACLAIQQLSQYLHETGRHLILCGLTATTWEVLSYSGTVDAVGRDNLFLASEREPKASLQKALRRARMLINSQPLLETTSEKEFKERPVIA